MDGIRFQNPYSTNQVGSARAGGGIQELSRIGKGDMMGVGGPSGDANTTSFAATLKQAIGNVNELQKDADVQMEKLATGQSQNLHETMIATEKADIALKLMVQVRNKIIDAYHEIMKMQV